MNRRTEAREALAKSLSAILDDRDFILGVICYLDNDAEIDLMADFIGSNEWNHPSDITLKALEIANDETRDRQFGL